MERPNNKKPVVASQCFRKRDFVVAAAIIVFFFMYLSWMYPMKLAGMGSRPAPLPLAVPTKHAPHINESPYCALWRATAAVTAPYGGRDTLNQVEVLCLVIQKQRCEWDP